MSVRVAYKFDANDAGGVTPAPIEDVQAPAPQVEETPQPVIKNELPPAPTQDAPVLPELGEPIEQPELNDDSLVAYLNKKNGTDFKTFDDYNTSLSKEVVKEVVKEPEYDADTAAYLKFKKETKGDFKEWARLNDNLDEKPDVQIAIDKIKQDNKGVKLSDSDALILLSEDLGIDIEDFEELGVKEKLKLSVLANKHRNVLKAEKEKYWQTSNDEADKQKSQPSGETVNIGGQVLDKAEHAKLRNEYLTSQKDAVKGIVDDVFSVDYEGKDGKKGSLSSNYVYTDEDKQGMLSITESIDNILPNFINKEGSLNHGDFNKGMWWSIPSNREKAIKSIIQQSRSAGIDEVLKQERNIDFDKGAKAPDTKETPEGYGKVGQTNQGGMSVKYKFNR